MAGQAVATGDRVKLIGAAVATGSQTSSVDYEFSRSTFTVYVDYSGAPATASIQLQSSPDGGTTWFNIGTASTTNTDHAFSVTGVAAQLVRVAVTVASGTAKVWIAAN